jgi:NADH-quinone oxidoreductase subunit H
MEPVVLSLLLTVYLYVLAVGLLVVERAAFSFAQSRMLPRWAGLGAIVQSCALELRHLCVAMPPMRDSGNFRRWLGGVIGLSATVLAFAVIPFGPRLLVSNETGPVGIMIAPDVDVALLFVPAMLLLGETGAVFAASGTITIRSAIGRLAVWTGLVLSTLGVARLSETLRLDEIVLLQEHGGIWWLARQPLGFTAMLLCMVWLTLDTRLPTNTAESRVDLHDDGRWQPKAGLFVLAARLQIIAVAYLLVVLFLGGWHLWGLAPASGDSGLTLTEWIVRLLVLQIKVCAVLIWRIWFQYVRRAQHNIGVWRTRVAVAAVSVAVLNVAVTESGEQFLDASSLMWKAAIGWAMLVAGLSAVAVLSNKLMSE